MSQFNHQFISNPLSRDELRDQFEEFKDFDECEGLVILDEEFSSIILASTYVEGEVQEGGPAIAVKLGAGWYLGALINPKGSELCQTQTLM